MLGETVRSARIKKNLTQAKLARLAGVSRRHLAALEKGANVSVLVVKKVASVLDLTDIDLGPLVLHSGKDPNAQVNMRILAETIREAHAGARSEERRVGKECRSRRWRERGKEKGEG